MRGTAEIMRQRTSRLPKRKLSNPRPKRLSKLAWGLIALATLIVASWQLPGAIQGLCNSFARRNVERLDSASALRWLELADRFGVDNPQSLLIRARLERQSGQYQRMATLLQRADRSGVDPGAVRMEELMWRAQIGNLDAVESELNDLLFQPGNDHAELSNAYANGLAIQGRMDELLVLLEAWESDFPEDPRANHRRGLALEFLQSPSAAAEQYQIAINKNKDYFPSWYNLGRVQQQQRELQKGLDSFRECLRMPNPLAAEIAIASCLRELGEFDQAREILQRVAAADAQLVQASYRAVEFAPRGDQVSRELGAMESEAGNFERACELLAKALADDPHDLVSRYSYAVSLRGIGDHEAAAENFELVKAARQALSEAPPLLDRVNKDPVDTDARLRLGEIHLKWESARHGLYWLNSVLAYDPQNIQAHLALAEYYSEKTSQKPEYAILAAKHRQAAQGIDQEKN